MECTVEVTMDSLLVPSSIQRIRAFLVEMCGMKVKPWASGDEMLAALHATLVARQSCDIFWTSLRVLLETLARDLEARQSATTGALVDNEILCAESYGSLLDEIRACLDEQTRVQAPSFRRLAQGLSVPALGLLLLLGGVATVGCEQSALHSPGRDAAVADASPGQPDSAGNDSTQIVFPDVAPTKNDVGKAPTGSDGATVTIQEILDSCNVPSDEQTRVLACLASVRESWIGGLADYLAGKNCNAVSSDLGCQQSGTPCNNSLSSATDFDPGELPICKPVLIYLGVRFV
jgi:hypothetical protein